MTMKSRDRRDAHRFRLTRGIYGTQKINKDIARVLESPEVRTMLEQQGAQPAGGTPEELRVYIPRK